MLDDIDTSWSILTVKNLQTKLWTVFEYNIAEGLVEYNKCKSSFCCSKEQSVA